MKTTILFLVFAILMTACSTSKKTTETKRVSSPVITKTDIFRGGTSFDNAVVIKVQKEGAGVEEEYKWLALNYPGYTTIRKTQTIRTKRHYDIIKIRTRDGQEKDIYFDTTSFFGKA